MVWVKAGLTDGVKTKRVKEKYVEKPLINRMKECLSMMDFWNMKEEIIKTFENKKKGVI